MRVRLDALLRTGGPRISERLWAVGSQRVR